MEKLFLHLTRHWLRLVQDSEDANRSRWPMHPTWQQLREAFGNLAVVPPLDDEKRTLVRGARYRGRMRLLRRMEAGVICSLEVEDASPTSTALMTLQRWMERIAELDGAHRGKGGRAHHGQAPTLSRTRQSNPNVGTGRDG
jgi:hypothetical protein